MSLETVTDCVVIPNPCDWADAPRLTRSWKTEVVTGLSGAEDRAASRAAKVRKIEYTLLADGVPERALLTERLKAALKAGRAVVPIHGRRQTCDSLTVADSIVLDKGYPWVAGEYVFLRLIGDHAENTHRGVNCGSASASGDFAGDGDYSIGYGSRVSTVSAVAVTGLRLTPPAQTVLRTARTWQSSTTPVYYVEYSMGGLDPARTYRVVLWFAGIDSYLAAANPTDLKFTIQIVGATTQTATDYAPLVAANGVLKATFLAYDVKPDANGRIYVVLTPTGYSNAPCGGDVIGRWCSINAIEIYDTRWELLEVSGVLDDPPYTALQFELDSTISERDSVQEVWPALFGTPTVGKLESITSEHGQIKLSVQEPPGAGVKDVNTTCAVEICGTPSSGAIDPTGLEPFATFAGVGGKYYIAIGSFDFPADFLSEPVMPFWQTVLEAQFTLYQAAHPEETILYRYPGYYYQTIPSGNSIYSDIRIKFTQTPNSTIPGVNDGDESQQNGCPLGEMYIAYARKVTP